MRCGCVLLLCRWVHSAFRWLAGVTWRQNLKMACLPEWALHLLGLAEMQGEPDVLVSRINSCFMQHLSMTHQSHTA